MHLEASQQLLDLELLLESPGGRRLHHFDSPFGSDGPELLCFVAPKSGRYSLRVAPFGQQPGRYRVRRLETRNATVLDRLCQEGQQQFMAAEERRLRQAPPAELLEAYSAAQRTFADAKEIVLEGLALREMGGAASQLGLAEDARNSYRNALQHFRDGEQPALVIQTLNFLGRLDLERGALAAAEERFQEALAQARDSADKTGEGTALNNLGRVAEERGDTFRALELYEKAVDRYRLRGRGFEEAQALRNLGYAHLLLGHARRARQILEGAIRQSRESDNDEAEAGSRINLGWCLLALGEVDPAIEQLERGKELHERAGRKKALAGVLDRLGTAYRRAGRQQEALKAYRVSLKIAAELENPRSRAPALANLGCFLSELGRHGVARDHLQEAIALFETLENPDGHAFALACRARLERGEGNWEAARRDFETALAIFDRMRTGARRWGGRFPSFAPWIDTEEVYIDLLVEAARWKGDPHLLNQAFEISDASRARNFYEQVLEGDLGFREAADPRFLSQEGRLQKMLVEATADAERERLRLKLAALRARIRTGHHRFEEYLRPPRVAVGELQELLGPSTTLLSFELAEERSFVFRLTSEGLAVFELGPRQGIEDQAERAHHALRASHKTGGERQARLVAQRLAETLLAPVLAGVESKRLVLVGDGWLYYLPWAALPRPGTDRYLSEDFEIVTLPAAGLLAPLRRRGIQRGAAETSVAAVADPVFSRDDPRLPSVSETCPPSADAPDLPRLINSRREAEAAVAHAAPGQGLLALDFDSRRELFFDGSLEPFRILHLATHAVADEEVPERSALYFSAYSSTGCPRQSALYLQEIFTLTLPADLVVLSTCRSALGQRVRGEGLQGLTRGFFSAGAIRLLVSLWPVDDDATAELMVRFYEAHLGDGLPAAAALRRAQQELRHLPRWSAPYFWAGFQLQGDWQSQQSLSQRDSLP